MTPSFPMYLKIERTQIIDNFESNIRYAFASSIDYSQHPITLLSQSKSAFWSSKGSDSEDSVESVTFPICGKLAIFTSFSIKFYIEESFAAPFNRFVSKAIKIKASLVEGGPAQELAFKELSQDCVEVEIAVEYKSFAKFITIEFIGKFGMQETDKKYYVAVERIRAKGKYLDITEELVDSLEPIWGAKIVEGYIEHLKNTGLPEFECMAVEKAVRSSPGKVFISDPNHINRIMHIPVLLTLNSDPTRVDKIIPYIWTFQSLRELADLYYIPSTFKSPVHFHQFYNNLHEKTGTFTVSEFKGLLDYAIGQNLSNASISRGEALDQIMGSFAKLQQIDFVINHGYVIIHETENLMQDIFHKYMSIEPTILPISTLNKLFVSALGIEENEKPSFVDVVRLMMVFKEFVLLFKQ